jgi:hypothetical protein
MFPKYFTYWDLAPLNNESIVLQGQYGRVIFNRAAFKGKTGML